MPEQPQRVAMSLLDGGCLIGLNDINTYFNSIAKERRLLQISTAYPRSAKHRGFWAQVNDQVKGFETTLLEIRQSGRDLSWQRRATAEAWSRFDEAMRDLPAKTLLNLRDDFDHANKIKPVCADWAQRQYAAAAAAQDLAGLDAAKALALYRRKAPNLPWAQRLEYDRVTEGIIRRDEPGLLGDLQQVQLANFTPEELLHAAAQTEVIKIKDANDATAGWVQIRIQELRDNGPRTAEQMNSPRQKGINALDTFDAYMGADSPK